MNKLLVIAMVLTMAAHAAELSTKKALNLATIKALVTAAEAEAQKRNVQVTMCVVDDSGNLLFLEKQDGAGLNTITFAQKKARHSAFIEPVEECGGFAKRRQFSDFGDAGLIPQSRRITNQSGWRDYWGNRSERGGVRDR